MEIRVYRPPVIGDVAFVPLGITNDATSIAYTERFFTYGTFEITIPTDAHGVASFEKYLFVLIDRQFWGLILSLERTIDAKGDTLTVAGLCLKGLTASRTTMPANFNPGQGGGVAGFDIVNGSTETCMKHFVESNFFNISAPARFVPGFTIAPDLGRGRLDELYMTRFDVLSTVLEELGNTAGIGYAITPELNLGTLTFDCAEGVNRAATQSDNPRMIFSVERRNTESMNYQDNDLNMRNFFYATVSGRNIEDDIYVATVTRNTESPIPSGLRRWEQFLDISAPEPEPGSELEELTQLAVVRAQSYVTAEFLSAVVLDHPKKYGVDYALGDIVTVQNRAWGVSMDTRVTAMTLNASAGSVTRTVTFGDAPVNPIARLRRQIRGG